LPYKLPVPIQGQQIVDLINNPEEKRKAFVEGLLHESSTIMFASDPGLGKSTLTVQACMEISAGLPVFGALTCPEPKKVYYIQKERSRHEILERIEMMQEHIAWNPENFIIDSEIQTFSLTNPANFKMIVERIRPFKPHIICIDPIGAGSPGLSQDEGANHFCAFLTYLQHEVGATHWLNHHTSRQTYSSKDGQKIEKDDPFYGSQWLKAHVSGSFHIQKTDKGTLWKNKKDSHSNLLEQLDLAFDNETFASSLVIDGLTVTDKIKRFCRLCKSNNKKFIFRELEAATTCARRTLRHTLSLSPFKDGIKRFKSSGIETLYEVIEDF